MEPHSSSHVCPMTRAAPILWKYTAVRRNGTVSIPQNGHLAGETAAEVRASLFRTDANGTVEVAKASALGQLLTPTVKEPGSYHVEIWITPKHFANVLGDQAALANTEYMWLITNPIRVK